MSQKNKDPEKPEQIDRGRRNFLKTAGMAPLAAGVGFGCFSMRATVAITNPGVQKPHISASRSQKACCTG